MFADTVIQNLSQIFVPNAIERPLRGSEMSQVNLITNGYIAIKDGKILKIASGKPSDSLINELTQVIEGDNKLATPGLIDCHTHLVYGGSRENEFSKKLNNVDYLDILKSGGGILSTVKATRKASFEELYKKSKQLLDKMLLHGVTSIEAKSGYGLNWETESRQLEVVKGLNEDHPINIVSTFMAAHAVPPEFKDRSDDFIDFIILEMLPKVKSKKLAEFCDVFCEYGVFSAEQSYRLLEAAKKLNFKLKIHTDEIKTIGGVDVASALHVTSAEHLMKITELGIKQLSEKEIIGNLLPGTTFSLMEKNYAPAREMLREGMAITLSTDSNPGSCPTANLQFIMQLGCFNMKLTPIEVFNAVTINAAYSINRGGTLGDFEVGSPADIVIFDAPNIDYAMYFFATNLVLDVFKEGKRVVHNGVRVV